MSGDFADRLKKNSLIPLSSSTHVHSPVAYIYVKQLNRHQRMGDDGVVTHHVNAHHWVVFELFRRKYELLWHFLPSQVSLCRYETDYVWITSHCQCPQSLWDCVLCRYIVDFYNFCLAEHGSKTVYHTRTRLKLSRGLLIRQAGS